jgi:hypothetical protein
VNEKLYTHVSKCKTDKIKERKKNQIVGKVTLDECVPDVLHSVSSGWSQKSLVEISGVWHPEQRTGWRQIAKQQQSFIESEGRKYTL